MDSEGVLILSKYYTARDPGPKDRLAFEKGLFGKTNKTASEVILFENYVVVYKTIVDLMVYFIGGLEENEIMIGTALAGYIDSLSIVLKTQVEKRLILEHLDVAMLCLDETIDNGVILESDPAQIAARITKRGEESLGEQTIASAWRTAQEQLARSFLK